MVPGPDHDLLADHPSRDAGLVGHHHDGIADPSQQSDRLDTPRIETKTLEAVEVTDILDQSAVAVKEHGGGSHSADVTPEASCVNEGAFWAYRGRVSVTRHPVGANRSTDARPSWSPTMRLAAASATAAA